MKSGYVTINARTPHTVEYLYFIREAFDENSVF